MTVREWGQALGAELEKIVKGQGLAIAAGVDVPAGGRARAVEGCAGPGQDPGWPRSWLARWTRRSPGAVHAGPHASDLTEFQIYRRKKSASSFRRAALHPVPPGRRDQPQPAKTQSALLQPWKSVW